jgi:hypothetical protein
MKFAINWERMGVIFLKGGYKALWIRYSNGIACLNNGKYKVLWCFPRLEFRRVPDFRRSN